ncbi:unnamed protein product [Vitrella brassicaformis CCMP3155]|uniref:Potassium channel domain-containing protein n=3 Tax=Vitrella brassicaformis TaxID=1169539 RepID=A0A0G4ETF5_VITBC|nr:unnamed protein product [Vitrella brassicaformis CCMP3155]|eukprot:CEM00939.1 unnamed protein product [Vitrella brassicaformis CCMP3155]
MGGSLAGHNDWQQLHFAIDWPCNSRDVCEFNWLHLEIDIGLFVASFVLMLAVFYPATRCLQKVDRLVYLRIQLRNKMQSAFKLEYHHGTASVVFVLASGPLIQERVTITTWLIELTVAVLSFLNTVVFILTSRPKTRLKTLESLSSALVLDALILPSILSMLFSKTCFSFSFFASIRVIQLYKRFLDSSSVKQSSIAMQIVSVSIHIGCSACIFLCLERAGNPDFLRFSMPFHLTEIEGDGLGISNEGLDFFSSCYFVMVTISTVGYGDVFPTTSLGRAFSVLMIAGGIAAFSISTRALVEAFRVNQLGHGTYSPKKRFKHIVVTGNPTVNMCKDFITELYHPDHSEESALIDVIFLLSGGEKRGSYGMAVLESLNNWLRHRSNRHLAERVNLLQGSILEPSDFWRSAAPSSTAIVIIANLYSRDPNVEDSENVVRVLSVKQRLPDVRVMCLLNKAQNYSLLKTADLTRRDVVCLDEFKLQVISKGCVVPGFSALICNLVKSISDDEIGREGDPQWLQEYDKGITNELYELPLSRAYVGWQFQDVFIDILQRSSGRSVHLIGFRYPSWYRAPPEETQQPDDNQNSSTRGSIGAWSLAGSLNMSMKRQHTRWGDWGLNAPDGHATAISPFHTTMTNIKDSSSKAVAGEPNSNSKDDPTAKEIPPIIFFPGSAFPIPPPTHANTQAEAVDNAVSVSRQPSWSNTDSSRVSGDETPVPALSPRGDDKRPVLRRQRTQSITMRMFRAFIRGGSTTMHEAQVGSPDPTSREAFNPKTSPRGIGEMTERDGEKPTQEADSDDNKTPLGVGMIYGIFIAGDREAIVQKPEDEIEVAAQTEESPAPKIVNKGSILKVAQTLIHKSAKRRSESNEADHRTDPPQPDTEPPQPAPLPGAVSAPSPSPAPQPAPLRHQQSIPLSTCSKRSSFADPLPPQLPPALPSPPLPSDDPHLDTPFVHSVTQKQPINLAEAFLKRAESGDGPLDRPRLSVPSVPAVADDNAAETAENNDESALTFRGQQVHPAPAWLVANRRLLKRKKSSFIMEKGLENCSLEELFLTRLHSLKEIGRAPQAPPFECLVNGGHILLCWTPGNDDSGWLGLEYFLRPLRLAARQGQGTDNAVETNSDVPFMPPMKQRSQDMLHSTPDRSRTATFGRSRRVSISVDALSSTQTKERRGSNLSLGGGLSSTVNGGLLPVVVLVPIIPRDWCLVADDPMLFYVEGSSTNLFDLERCAFRRAKAIVVQANPSSEAVNDPYMMDASTVFSVRLVEGHLTDKSLLASLPGKSSRPPSPTSQPEEGSLLTRTMDLLPCFPLVIAELVYDGNVAFIARDRDNQLANEAADVGGQSQSAEAAAEREGDDTPHDSRRRAHINKDDGHDISDQEGSESSRYTPLHHPEAAPDPATTLEDTNGANPRRTSFAAMFGHFLGGQHHHQHSLRRSFIRYSMPAIDEQHQQHQQEHQEQQSDSRRGSTRVNRHSTQAIPSAAPIKRTSVDRRKASTEQRRQSMSILDVLVSPRKRTRASSAAISPIMEPPTASSSKERKFARMTSRESNRRISDRSTQPLSNTSNASKQGESLYGFGPLASGGGYGELQGENEYMQEGLLMADYPLTLGHSPYHREYYRHPRYSSGELFVSCVTSSLIVNALFNPSLPLLVREMVASRILVLSVPASFAGRQYEGLVKHFLDERDLLPIVLYRSAFVDPALSPLLENSALSNKVVPASSAPDAASQTPFLRRLKTVGNLLGNATPPAPSHSFTCRTHAGNFTRRSASSLGTDDDDKPEGDEGQAAPYSFAELRKKRRSRSLAPEAVHKGAETDGATTPGGRPAHPSRRKSFLRRLSLALRIGKSDSIVTEGQKRGSEQVETPPLVTAASSRTAVLRKRKKGRKAVDKKYPVREPLTAIQRNGGSKNLRMQKWVLVAPAASTTIGALDQVICFSPRANLHL